MVNTLSPRRGPGPNAPGAQLERGFTLTEALIVLVVLGVLMAAGLPSFSEFVRNQRVKNASFDIFSALVQARSEAISRNAAVTLSRSGGDWTGGWTVAAGGTVIHTHEAIPNITITGPASVVYGGGGRLSAAVAPFQLTAAGTGVITRCITIDLSGRPLTKAAAC